MFTCTADELTQLQKALDSLSWIFANQAMDSVRTESYLTTLLTDQDATSLDVVLEAIRRTNRQWEGRHFPWPADILSYMPRPRRVVL